MDTRGHLRVRRGSGKEGQPGCRQRHLRAGHGAGVGRRGRGLHHAFRFLVVTMWAYTTHTTFNTVVPHLGPEIEGATDSWVTDTMARQGGWPRIVGSEGSDPALTLPAPPYKRQPHTLTLPPRQGQESPVHSGREAAITVRPGCP